MADKNKFDWNTLGQAMAESNNTAIDPQALAGMARYAYNAQHDFRAQHPLVDAAINFIPYVGAAASADDTVRSLADGKYGEAAVNAVGMLPGMKLLKMGGNSALSAASRYLVSSGNAHLIHDLHDYAHMAGYGAVSIGGGGYMGNAAATEKIKNQ